MRKRNPGAILILVAISLCPVAAKPRLLPPSAFPELPPAVMQSLQARGCQIPQIQRRKRNNVIQGSFLKSGQTDWAILCTTKTTTELLVFRDGLADLVMTIVSSRNGFYRWSISAIAASEIPRLKNGKPFEIDHDGLFSVIESGDPDAGCLYCYSAEGKTLYDDHGQWVELSGYIAN